MWAGPAVRGAPWAAKYSSREMILGCPCSSPSSPAATSRPPPKPPHARAVAARHAACSPCTTRARCRGGGSPSRPTLYNRDRDPLGIDVFDYSLAGAVGLTPRIEAYGSGVFSRVVVVPDFSQTWPALPPPPLDLVLPEAMAVPERPYYAIVADLSLTRTAAATSGSPTSFPATSSSASRCASATADEGRTGFAVGGEIKIPLTRRMGALQSGSGTGGVDLTAARHRREALRGDGHRHLGRLHLRRAGRRSRDRLLIANPDGIRRSSRSRCGCRAGSSSAAACAARSRRASPSSARWWRPSRSTARRRSTASRPSTCWPGSRRAPAAPRLTAGVLYAGGLAAVGRRAALAAGRVRGPEPRRAQPTPRALPAAGRARRRGARTCAPGAQLVTPRVPGAALPDGARVIPDTYTIISEHQLGFVVVLGWALLTDGPARR